MRCLHAMLACLLTATPSQAQTLSGRWCGMAEQTGPGDYRSEWSAVLDLKGATGRMAYPSLDCGGELTFERMDGNVHLYRERIDYGRNRCLDGGLVAIEPLGTTVRWEWNGSGARATALLYAHCPQQSPNAGNTLRRSAIAIHANRQPMRARQAMSLAGRERCESPTVERYSRGQNSESTALTPSPIRAFISLTTGAAKV